MTNILNTKKRFKKVYVEITNICNLNCPFCAGTLRPPRFMETHEFSIIAPQIKDVSDYVYLHILGEPTLHPYLEKICDICYDTGLYINLTTNGTLAEKIPAAHSALRKVSFSLHSAQVNSLDADEYASKVKTAANLLLKNKKIVEYKFWDGSDFSDAESYAGRLFFALSPDAKIHISGGKTFIWPHKSDCIRESGFCMGLRDQCGILCDGTVVPCCLDSEGTIALGNIFTDRLSDILSRDAAKKLYDGFSERKAVFPLCRRCGFYETRSSPAFVSK